MVALNRDNERWKISRLKVKNKLCFGYQTKQNMKDLILTTLKSLQTDHLYAVLNRAEAARTLFLRSPILPPCSRHVPHSSETSIGRIN